jgi:hypothetical protein
MEPSQKLGKCGVYCGQCRAFNSEVADLATTLEKWVKQDYSWIKDVEQSFDYNNFLKGLEWFKDSTCPGCRQVEESWCDVKTCEKIQKNENDNCLLCKEFLKCPLADYQRNRYSYLFEHIEYIKKESFEKYLEREEKASKNGVRIQDIRDY